MFDVGWREKVTLPEFSNKQFKAKMDTGARSSALHVDNLDLYTNGDQQMARFTILVGRRTDIERIQVSAPVIAVKSIKSSNGSVEERPTIRTLLHLNGDNWPIDITLTDRSNMKYRMLIGRDAMANKLRVCPSKSYLLG